MRRNLLLPLLPLMLTVPIGFWTLSSFQRSHSQQKRKLLMVAHSAGFQHSVVKRPEPQKLSLAEQVVKDMGEKSGTFEVTFIYTKEECQRVTADYLKDFDAVLFDTTGDLPIPEDGRKGLLEFVKSGKGFIGVHNATDTWYNFPEFGEMIGGYFDGHPWHQKVRIIVEDKNHPATKHLGDSFEITDEIYQFKHPYSRQKVRVLLSIDNDSIDVTKGKRQDKDYAVSWVRNYGKGRVFYTSLGHREEVWQDERFHKHLLNGILWAMGDLPGDATPLPKPGR